MAALLETQDLALLKSPQGEKNHVPQAVDYLIEGISLRVGTGEVFGISGPSGSGKSTLLKLLCRLEEPSAGEVLFQGQSIKHLDPRELRRKVTLVFQTPILMGPTISDDLNLSLKWRSENHRPRATRLSEGEAEALLRRVHLPMEILQTKPKNLSVGEAQRVALARALVLEPQVLLLDEPTSALDPVSKEKIETTIRELTQGGLTVLLVSHDPEQIKRLALRGLVLKSGRMQGNW